jgi:hypothetical protein
LWPGGPPRTIQTNSPSVKEVLDFSVIIPLPEHRGHWHESIDSWCRKQTHPRHRYEVIVLSNHKCASLEPAVRQLLTPHDSLVRIDSHNDFFLYNEGARLARGRFLFFTEAHAVGTPACLSAMLTFLTEADYVGACCMSEGLYDTWVGEMQERIYQEEIPLYSQQDHWHRIAERGCAIDRALYLEVGGFNPDFHLFAERALGIRLHQLGKRLGYARSAIVRHWNSVSLADIMHPTGEFIHGECVYRDTFPASHCEQYLGVAPEWLERDFFTPAIARLRFHALLNYMLAGFKQRPRDVTVWARLPELVDLSLLAIFGAEWQCIKARAKLLQHEWKVRFWQRFDRERCYNAFRLYWYTGLVRYFRTRYFASSTPADDRPCPPRHHYSASDSLERYLVGFHSLEYWHDKPYRWSQPVSVVRVAVPPADYELALSILPFRPDHSGACPAAYLDGSRLELLPSSEDRLVFRVRSSQFGRGAGIHYLALVCQPFLPGRHGSADGRALGLAVRSITFEGVHSASRPASVAGDTHGR